LSEDHARGLKGRGRLERKLGREGFLCNASLTHGFNIPKFGQGGEEG